MVAVVSVVFIFIAKLGIRCRLVRNAEPRYELPFQHKRDLPLLTLLLIYRLSSTCLCRGAILFGENLIIHNVSDLSSLTSTGFGPSAANTDESSQEATLASQTSVLTVATATADESNDSLYIVRNGLGDTFLDMDNAWLSCSMEKCIRQSSGTAAVALELSGVGDGRKSFFDRYTANDKLCHCRCHQNTPTFREDLHVCVNDIHECSLVSFVSSNGQQKIPYVFLPLRGQIIYPNAEIKFHGLHSVPTCVVSRVRYLSRSGWCDIKNYSNERGSLPFRLFHDKQRTFLQWLGSAELRISMEGRLLLIDLICKDVISQLIFTPCISFKVAGVPNQNKFFFDELLDRNNINTEKEKKFSTHEYVALGFATLLIALIYVASVFMYLHFKKSKLKETSLRRSNAFKQFFDMEDSMSHPFSDIGINSVGQSKQLIVEQEGLVKNNPLLMKRYQAPSSPSSQAAMSTGEAACKFNSDQTDLYKSVGPKSIPPSEKTRVTNVLTHNADHFSEPTEPRWSIFRNRLLQRNFDSHPSHVDARTEVEMDGPKISSNDANNMEEKHPDEDISIVECPEDVVPANSKHKLYFNPAYLEPELLMAPPPAAVEFLFKIREIMSMARRKLTTKKFLPTLTEIPEETPSHGESTATRRTTSSHRCVSEKQNSPYLLKEDKEKRQIIQKWLQTIPTSDGKSAAPTTTKELSTFLGTDDIKPVGGDFINDSTIEFSERSSIEENKQIVERTASLPKRREVPKKPKRNLVKSNSSTLSEESSPSVTEISFDSLDKRNNAGKSCANQNVVEDVKDATKNSLSGEVGSNLPLDEEMTMQNAIFNVVTGNMTVSKLKMREHGFFSRFDDNAEESKYSLVSEVYVNDEFSSDGDSLSLSANSVDDEAEEKQDEKHDVANRRENASATATASDKQFEESSRLMIQLNDCPFFYSMNEADDFEPDTLDRKVVNDEPDYRSNGRPRFIDSLERPAICLRSHGSFRNEVAPLTWSQNNQLKNSFGSLQEIYQSRRQLESDAVLRPIECEHNGPQSLNLHSENTTPQWKRENFTPRHYFRQCRQSSPPPLPPQNSDGLSSTSKPPIPPKREQTNETPKINGTQSKSDDCATNGVFANRVLKLCFNNHVWSYKPDDSGYLSSSDSDKSQVCAKSMSMSENRDVLRRIGKKSTSNEDDDDEDDDDSCSNDGNSESGAESTATNFKFYKNSVKLINDLNEPMRKEPSLVSPY